MNLKLLSKDIIIKMVKTFLMYVFAFVGISTMSSSLIFNEKQTKAELVKHIILGMLIAFILFILKEEKLETGMIENKEDQKL